MFDFSTAAVTVTISSAIQYGFYLFLRRPLDRVDKLETKIEDQIGKQISNLESGQKSEGDKRKVIYERLEKIELNYRQTAECVRIHNDVVRMHEQFLATTLRLEGVATKADNLIKRMDEISAEQTSLGKDISDLSARMEERKK